MRSWFDKLEHKIDTLTKETIKQVTELTTLIGVYLPKQTELEDRVTVVEKDVDEMKQEAENRHRNTNVWLGIGTIAATIGAVIAGILIDKYFLK